MPSRQKRLLIAGGGHSDIPLIEAAKRLGYHVITTGNRADDIGHLYGDEIRLADYSNEATMLALARKMGIEAVCACCNDFSAISAAYVAEHLGLPGHDSYETTKLIHHKDRYREFAREHGLSSPDAAGFDNLEAALNAVSQRFRLPVIIKPVDLSGGKGISTATEWAAVRPALETAFSVSRAKRIVVEEFVTGSRHGLSTFIRDGQVIFSFNDNEHYYLNPYLVSAASVPGDVPSTAVSKLRTEIEKIAGLLALKDGIVHVQYILRGHEPVIIEICRRAPGDLYVRLVEHATGVDYGAFIVATAAGLGCREMKHVEPSGFFTRHCVMSDRRGELRGVTFDSSIQAKVIDKLMWWKVGDVVEDELIQKFGIVFLRFDSMVEMMNLTDQMQALIRADVV